MNTITIPKKLANKDDLVVIPRKEYEKLLERRVVPVFNATMKEKKDLARARENRVKGNFLTIYELKQKLGFTD